MCEDEKLAKGSKGKGGKKVGVVVKKEEDVGVMGWQMDAEGIAELLDIWENLVERMKEDDGLRQWVEDWKRELGDGRRTTMRTTMRTTRARVQTR